MSTVKRVIEVANDKKENLIKMLKEKFDKCMLKDISLIVTTGNDLTESRSCVQLADYELDTNHLNLHGIDDYSLCANFKDDTKFTYHNEFDEQDFVIINQGIEIHLLF